MAVKIPDFVLREMLGGPMMDAVVAARSRTGDASVSASCAEGLWSVTRKGKPVATRLAHDAALEALAALT